MNVAMGVGIAVVIVAIIISFFGTKSVNSNEVVERLTLKYLKTFRKESNSTIIVANLTSMRSKINDDKIIKLFENFVKENPQAVIIAEYNEKSEKVIHYIFAKDCDDEIYSVLSENGGIVALVD